MSEDGLKVHVRESATGEERKALELNEDNCTQQLKIIYQEYCEEV